MSRAEDPQDATPAPGAPDAPDGPVPSAPAEDDDDDTSTSFALAVAFGMPGVVLMLLLEDARVVGLPFLVLGLFYLGKAIRASRTARPDGDAPPRT